MNNNWWKGATLYQVYPRSFNDSNGDGVGDLNGITEKLDYIADLGVDGVWISPFFKSPMRDFGYDVSDYCGVDPLFGTIEDFKKLVGRAHELNLKVIIDQVLSHSSSDHSWFQESRQSKDNPKSDWYVWADAKDDGSPPNNWLAIFGGSAWEWEPRRAQYYLHNFLKSQPDLNWYNPEVKAAMFDAMRFWLDLGVDGFRLDAINFILHDQQLRDNPPRPVDGTITEGFEPSNPYARQKHIYDKSRPEALQVMEEIRDLLDEYPNTTIVGEIGDDNSLERAAEYTQNDDRLHMVYTFNLLGRQFGASFLKQTVEEAESHLQNGWFAWSLNNHDVARSVSRLGDDAPSPEKAKMLLSLLLSLRGTLFLYQGEELGLPEADVALEDMQDPYGITFYPEFKGRDGCRTPMPWEKDQPNAGFSAAKPWLPIPAEHLNLAANQQADENSLMTFYKDMIRWRKNQETLISGDIKLTTIDDNILLVERRHENKQLHAFFNCSSKPQEAKLAVSDLQAHPDINCQGQINGDTLSLPAYGWVYAKPHEA